MLIGVVILAIVVPVIVALLEEEAIVQVPRLAAWIVRRAAGRLPEPIRERYTEEWLAEVAAEPGPLSKVATALSIRAFAKVEAIPVVPVIATTPPPTPPMPELRLVHVADVHGKQVAIRSTPRSWGGLPKPVRRQLVVAMTSGFVTGASAAVIHLYVRRTTPPSS